MDGFPDFGRLRYESGFTMSVTSHALRLVFVIAVSSGVSSQLFGSQAELIDTGTAQWLVKRFDLKSV